MAPCFKEKECYSKNNINNRKVLLCKEVFSFNLEYFVEALCTSSVLTAGGLFTLNFYISSLQQCAKNPIMIVTHHFTLLVPEESV